MDIKKTRYYIEQVARKRPYLKDEWLELAIKKPVKIEMQSNERIRHWIYIESEKKYLRVVLLEDRETVQNAFFDRNFKEEEK